MASAKHQFTRNLTAALLAGEWQAPPMRDRCARACGRKHRWIPGLVLRVLAAFPTAPDAGPLNDYLDSERQFGEAWGRSLLSPSGYTRFRIAEAFWVTPRMGETAVPMTEALPSLPTTGAVGAWLGLSPRQLDWFADLFDANADEQSEFLRHYFYLWVPKRRRAPAPAPPAAPPRGGLLGWVGSLFASPPPPPTPPPGPPTGVHRLLEAPKPRLKAIQRKILDDILGRVPPHSAAHGFRRGASVVTNAAPHCGQEAVVKFDLTDFFPSVPAARVHGVFRTLGYPHAVASVLTGLCTARTPRLMFLSQPNRQHDRAERDNWSRLRVRHLPQGAPTSPGLANLAAYHLDCRLTGLATYFGATYTRYADDLTFSGGRLLLRRVDRLRLAVTDIAADEGFVVNPHKTRAVGRAGRQMVTGVVVNVRPNVRRADFDALKAILTNCVRHGPASQNRAGVRDFRAHLLGRVAQVAQVNAARGAKLKAIFERIAWPA